MQYKTAGHKMKIMFYFCNFIFNVRNCPCTNRCKYLLKVFLILSAGADFIMSDIEDEYESVHLN